MPFSDADVFEAIAAFDYEGRTEGELSFKQGDTLLLFNQKSTDWWEGAHQGKEGYIPDKYIHIKQLVSSVDLFRIRELEISNAYKDYVLVPKNQKPANLNGVVFLF